MLIREVKTQQKEEQRAARWNERAVQDQAELGMAPWRSSKQVVEHPADLLTT